MTAWAAEHSCAARLCETRDYARRPLSRIIQDSMDVIVSMPFWCQLSCARHARTSSSEEAKIACKISRSPASGPPRRMNPSSTSQSMNRACSSHPSRWRRSRDQSHRAPRSRRTAKNTRWTLRRVPAVREWQGDRPDAAPEVRAESAARGRSVPRSAPSRVRDRIGDEGAVRGGGLGLRPPVAERTR